VGGVLHDVLDEVGRTTRERSFGSKSGPVFQDQVIEIYRSIVRSFGSRSGLFYRCDHSPGFLVLNSYF
jgi:hypothetical protein